MDSIFSTQNLQTFLRRKYLRPPSREPPGPPPGRGPRGPRSLRSCRSLRSAGRVSPPVLSATAAGAFVSSAIVLLKNSRYLQLVVYSLIRENPRQSAEVKLPCAARLCRLHRRRGRFRAGFRTHRGGGSGAGLLARAARFLDFVEPL